MHYADVRVGEDYAAHLPNRSPKERPERVLAIKRLSGNRLIAVRKFHEDNLHLTGDLIEIPAKHLKAPWKEFLATDRAKLADKHFTIGDTRTNRFLAYESMIAQINVTDPGMMEFASAILPDGPNDPRLAMDNIVLSPEMLRAIVASAHSLGYRKGRRARR